VKNKGVGCERWKRYIVGLGIVPRKTGGLNSVFCCFSDADVIRQSMWSQLSDKYLSATALSNILSHLPLTHPPTRWHPTMSLTSRVSRTLITRRAAPLRKPHFTSTLTGARRAYVQPSGADRASVVVVPSAYQDESHFAPRAGICSAS
jgi:hypothetical protein